MEDCLFCKIAAGEIPSTKVYEDDHWFAFRDINPSAPVHVLLIPRQHVKNILALTDETNKNFSDFFLVVKKIADRIPFPCAYHRRKSYGLAAIPGR